MINDSELKTEVLKHFSSDSLLLRLGYINSTHIKTFIGKRPYEERRLVKISTLPDCPSSDDVHEYAKMYRTNASTIETLLSKRIENDPFFTRSDKHQKRISIETQISLMKFIEENSQFSPGDCGIKRKRVSDVKNLAMRLFYR